MYSPSLMDEGFMVFRFFPASKPEVVDRDSSKCKELIFFMDDLRFHYRSRELHANRIFSINTLSNFLLMFLSCPFLSRLMAEKGGISSLYCTSHSSVSS